MNWHCKFANAGHQVLALSRKTPKALIEHQNITCLSIDLSKESDLIQVENFLKSSWKNVDAIIHNAGSLLFKPFGEITSAEFENIYKVNVFGVANLTRVCLPLSTKRKPRSNN